MTYNNTCKFCNKEFIHNRKSGLCSITCKDEYYAERNRTIKNIVEISRECKRCSKGFKTTDSKRKFCSDNCRIEQQKEKYRSNKSFYIFNRDNFTCIYCKKSSLTDNIILHVDHIYPLNKGGDNSDFNLITSCQSCNTAKTDKIMDKEVILNLWKVNIEKNNLSFEELKSKL